MKIYLKSLLLIFILGSGIFSANAQFYQIANQLPGLIRPALSGSLNYKGYADVSYLKGLGNRQIDFVSISTSQGFRYNNWFYMGVGIGVDIAMSHTNGDFGYGNVTNNSYWNHGYKTSGVMIPVFTDFRFNIGKTTSASFYADVRLGASFLMGNNYIAVADGFITSREYFYLKPSAGVRIPIGTSGKQAVDIGLTYQLLTSNYWYNTPSPYNVTLSSLGATVAFDW